MGFRFMFELFRVPYRSVKKTKTLLRTQQIYSTAKALFTRIYNKQRPNLCPEDPHLSCVCTVVVTQGDPPFLRESSPVQLLHAASHRRIPSEDMRRSFRLLSVPRNMKRPMQRAGLAANEQTVGGWLLPHTSAARGPKGKEARRQGTLNSNRDVAFSFGHYVLGLEHFI